jgi:hypothetical protein
MSSLQLLGRSRAVSPFGAGSAGRGRISPRPIRAVVPVRAVIQTLKPKDEKKDSADVGAPTLALAGLMAPLLLDAGAAQAIGREYGFVEGQIMSLTHPFFMFFLFGASVYTGYLGFQWQRTRNLGEEIKALKKERKPAIVGADGQMVPQSSPLDAEISAMEAVSNILHIMMMG